MNSFVKTIMVAALAVTTMGAGTTTQVQAGSDFGKTLLGIAAVGVIIHEAKKDKAHKSRSHNGHAVRSHQRKIHHSNHHAYRHNSGHGNHHARKSRHYYGH